MSAGVRPGDRVRIERDETRFPAKGTWREYRGKIGTVVEVNRSCPTTSEPEIGVAFGATPRTEAWFLPHAVKRISTTRAESDADASNGHPAGVTTGTAADGAP